MFLKWNDREIFKKNIKDYIGERVIKIITILYAKY